VVERLVLFQRVGLATAREGDASGGLARVFAIWIWILGFGDLLINVAGLVLPIERFKTTRLEIMRGQGDRGVFGFRCRTMKKRKRLAVVFLGERHLRERIRGRSGKLTFTIIIQDSLKIGPRVRRLIEIPIALA